MRRTRRANLPNAFPGFLGNTQHLFSRPQEKPTSPETPSKIVKSGNKGNLIVLILDESGSMGLLNQDTLIGVNSFLDAQRKDDIKSHIRIVKFEGGKLKTIRNDHIDNIKNLTRQDYNATIGGGTNLLDAVAMTLLDVNNHLKTFKRKEQRPSVIFQITTDGEENCSVEYKNSEKVKALVDQANNAGWLFTFIGAGIDAYKSSASLGIAASATSNYNTVNTVSTYDALSTSVLRAKHAFAQGASNHNLYASAAIYNDEERTKMGEKK